LPFQLHPTFHAVGSRVERFSPGAIGAHDRPMKCLLKSRQKAGVAP
jgi:hypothetical protein